MAKENPERARAVERLAEAGGELLARPGVAMRRMFGSEALSVRGKMLPARIAPMPFVPHRYKR